MVKTLPHALKYALACLPGIGLGGLLIAISVLMLTDLPEEKNLKWLQSSEVAQVKYSQSEGRIRGIQLVSASGQCLSIPESQDGFSEILGAVKNKTHYAIGFNEERELFSSDSKRYSVVYVVEVGGTSVHSFSDRVRATYYVFGGLFLVGLIGVASPIYAFSFRRIGPDARSQLITKWATFTVYLAVAVIYGIASDGIWSCFIFPEVMHWPAALVSGLFSVVVFVPMMAIMSGPLSRMQKAAAKDQDQA